MSEIMEMLVRRGFLWQSFEIYGGMAGFIDYGPLGNAVRRKLENLWRKYFVINERSVEIDTPTIGVEEVFIASGHAEGFTDVAIECESCGRVFRADHYIKEKLNIEVDPTIERVWDVIVEFNLKCECGGNFKKPFHFNLMFETKIGPGKGKKGYLRPETAQGIFIAFKRLSNYFRDKLPFGVAQIGRAYRNEISPRQGVIRLREFNQAELEFFCHPGEKKHPEFYKYANDVVTLVDKFDKEHRVTLKEAVERGIIAHELLAYFIGKTRRFLLEAGVKDEKLRFRQHKDDERAHYAVDCWDAEALTSYGWVEIVGIADRSDYDLSRHTKFSGEDLSVFVPFKEPIKVKRKKVVPNLAKLGPVYKDKAKKIAEELEKIENAGDEIEVVVDGEKIKLSKEFYEVKEVEEEVHGERIIPHVVEPSFGLDRITYVLLEHAFDKDVVDGEERRVLRLKRWMAPIDVAVLPLLSREEFQKKALEIVEMLRENGIYTEYDDSGSIGRRYRRFDEVGVPFCVTVDHQTFEDDTVTIRDRDTTKQVRVKVEELVGVLKELLNSEKSIEEFGEIFKA
ncbi:glycyl-tRNA synthetase [Ferroglobus placidus DSM 10642]|uniref:Glycine--tRNA ligase n=1 Tax=Ferroglobus placidus (strain DSM 10642 / AEDII12DO) TaxID=589924 RepID=D3RYL6_FERPA|nr:glycine--tRNA ligase [Ferroglobus placidus]ADC65579.1 glycyl-tRNA synthetase [Ferroglobus placidus DSM 10642]